MFLLLFLPNAETFPGWTFEPSLQKNTQLKICSVTFFQCIVFFLRCRQPIFFAVNETNYKTCLENRAINYLPTHSGCRMCASIVCYTLAITIRPLIPTYLILQSKQNVESIVTKTAAHNGSIIHYNVFSWMMPTSVSFTNKRLSRKKRKGGIEFQVSVMK